MQRIYVIDDNAKITIKELTESIKELYKILKKLNF